LVAQFYGKYEIYAQGRDAQKLLKLKMRYPGLNLVLGDLRCHGLREAVQCSSVVIHAAAQKYVDLAEQHCQYTVDTNVSCTHELAELRPARASSASSSSAPTRAAPRPTSTHHQVPGERLILELADVYTQTSS